MKRAYTETEETDIEIWKNVVLYILSVFLLILSGCGTNSVANGNPYTQIDEFLMAQGVGENISAYEEKIHEIGNEYTAEKDGVLISYKLKKQQEIFGLEGNVSFGGLGIDDDESGLESGYIYTMSWESSGTSLKEAERITREVKNCFGKPIMSRREVTGSTVDYLFLSYPEKNGYQMELFANCINPEEGWRIKITWNDFRYISGW